MTPTAAANVATRRWVSLAGICTAAGIVWLAFADLGVALPTIANEFHADLGTLEWANNAFSLVTGALVIAAGKFGDIFGRRRMLLLGTVLFAAFSVVGAVANGSGLLIAGRGLMGIGAALILPATLALIPPQFSGAAQLTAFGVWQAVAWGGQAVGPAVGGVLTETLSWRWLFWLNLPLAALAFLVVRAFTPESSDPGASRRIDWAGLATIGLAVFALLYALTDGPSAGWGDPLVVALAVAAVALGVAWYFIESRVREPLVDLSLFKIKPYDGALIANLTMNLSFAGLNYLLVLWLQNVRGYDAIQAGLLMLPSTLGIFLFIPLGGRMSSRVGSRRPVYIGLLIMSAGILVLGLVREDVSLGLIMAALVITGLGLGLLSTPISNTAVGDVAEDLAGTAAGVFKMSSMVGGALGVALLTAFARSFGSKHTTDAAQLAGLTDQQVTQTKEALVGSSSFSDALTHLPQELQATVTRVAKSAFTDGVADAFIITGVVGVLATIVVVLVWPARTGNTGPEASD
ncbi:drug resistance transporter, EmrB/QacA subfamily [Frankineae bacterium MT45]|nr:drug resistance transporter, EmrB/QacA subfamily [Frankineae bacterium MT45]